MNEKSWFDNLILQNLMEKGAGPFDYKMGEHNNPVYYSREAFDAFKSEMQSRYPQAYNQYGSGKGSEMTETSTPPKMASVASSSRFAYLALRDGAQAIGGTNRVVFEKECRIRGIRKAAPQLDAYTTDEKGNPIYVEVKCHEIFDDHEIRLRPAYWEKIYGEHNEFGFPAKEIPNTEPFSIPASDFGVSGSPMMDIKQLLCHLMGVASKKEQRKPATLVYLFFKPRVTGEARSRLDGIFTKLAEEIDEIFNRKPIQNFCRVNNIDLEVVVEEAPTMEALTTNNIGYRRHYPHP